VGAKNLLIKEKNAKLCVSEITIFEVAKGIFWYKDKRNFKEFLNFLESLEIIPANSMFSLDAAKISADLKDDGMIIDNEDLLIAGMMLNFGIDRIATRNKKHFSKIKGLEVISY